jgi:NADH-quinone oxidoreductase subunit L
MNAIQQFFMTSPFATRNVADALWLVIAFPAVGALVNGVFGRRLGRANVNLIGTAAVAGSFIMSLMAFWAINDLNTLYVSPFSNEQVRYALAADYGTWFKVGDFAVQFGLRVDHLTGTLLLIITGVGTLIHLYSTEYMSHDDGYWRYFAYLNLFVAMMLILVMGDNLLLLFVGWEGVGLCSYLLIGFWYADPVKAYAGRKAFVVNRIGDFGFLLGVFLLVLLIGAFGRQADTLGNFRNPEQAALWRSQVTERGPLDFQALEVLARSIHFSDATAKGRPGVTLDTEVASGPLAGHTYGNVLLAILLLFLLGAAGKSAQLPLYVWLPDAMAGPTPVSALIHAATMVTAGVYLFCRISYLLVLSPTAMAVVAIIGALTALFAALIAFAQDDIKKVLAYSTVSQLGIMFIGVGVGAFWAAVLHLVTHAFFKACLFLGAGSVMHGNGDETDIKKLGGLRPLMKVTWLTFAVATVAITGFLPLSGFFSKDAILHAAHSTTLLGQAWAGPAVFYLGLLAAACTAFYMTRLYVLTFEGKRSADARIPAGAVHESRWAMTAPLVVLAAMSVAGLFYGVPMMQPRGQNVSFIDREPVMQNFLSPVFRTTGQVADAAGTVVSTHGGLWASWGIAWLIALLATFAAVFAYLKFFPARAGQPAPAFALRIRTWARDKFYVDEVYDWVPVRLVKGSAFVLYKVVDTLLIDTVLVRGTAWVTSRLAAVMRYFQTGDVQSYAAVMALAILGGVAWALLKVLQ